MFLGISSRSFLLKAGRMISSIPALWAARTLDLIPPTGRTRPWRVISPVMATSLRTGFPVKVESMDESMVTPAEGPSFGIAPSGTWM
ncbi:MAG: hypothetical protein BWY86_00275 [Candidatus Aminicenantes bacterium ADurb.Bin508]|nr:MAG: hypothetical protein BWY86_00275 [Candidatus Aminicenantes bacterium ADurb.Bin508]